MAALEVKAVEHLLGTSVPYAYAVKAGPWIFLTGHEAFDFDAGVSEAVSGPPGSRYLVGPAGGARVISSCSGCSGSFRNSAPISGTAFASISSTRPRRRSTPTTWRAAPPSATTSRRALR